MSARELHSLRGRQSSSPKRAGGRKRLQSNADEVIAKRSKINEEDEAEQAEQPVKKAVTVTKGNLKGKKEIQARFVA